MKRNSSYFAALLFVLALFGGSLAEAQVSATVRIGQPHRGYGRHYRRPYMAPRPVVVYQPRPVYVRRPMHGRRYYARPLPPRRVYVQPEYRRHHRHGYGYRR